MSTDKKVFVAVALGVVAVGAFGLYQLLGLGDPPPPNMTPAEAAAEAHPSYLYGRITTNGGETYEGRLRWGRDQEAFWGDYFNGSKEQNPWTAYVPTERLRGKTTPVTIFGLEVGEDESPMRVARPFLARFGDIARVERKGNDAAVTLKSGSVHHLDWNAFNDLDDGVRVFDGTRGVRDLDARRIHAVDFLPAPREGNKPDRLRGTVRTPQGEFTGFVQWNRKDALGSDSLRGRTESGPVALPFDTIRSIEHRGEALHMKLVDGREVVFPRNPEGRDGRLGIYVDDPRYSRVLVSWEAFERLDFAPGDAGPSYDDFPPGRPLKGSITTRDGRHLAGRIVFDIDESETTETLDAPSRGVDYTIPFGLVAAIALPAPKASDEKLARVTLWSGEELRLERTGDLGNSNGGLVIFTVKDGVESSEYILWSDVAQIDLERPKRMYPPANSRPRS